MTDVYQPDPNRICFGHATGDLQAWKPAGDDVSICMSLNAHIKYKGDTQAWVYFTQYMSASDARRLAAGLLRCADHVDALLVQMPTPAEVLP